MHRTRHQVPHHGTRVHHTQVLGQDGRAAGVFVVATGDGAGPGQPLWADGRGELIELWSGFRI